MSQWCIRRGDVAEAGLDRPSHWWAWWRNHSAASARCATAPSAASRCVRVGWRAGVSNGQLARGPGRRRPSMGPAPMRAGTTIGRISRWVCRSGTSCAECQQRKYVTTRHRNTTLINRPGITRVPSVNKCPYFVTVSSESYWYCFKLYFRRVVVTFQCHMLSRSVHDISDLIALPQRATHFKPFA